MNLCEIEKKTPIRGAVLFDEVDSTNDVARRFLRDPENARRLPWLVCAERQRHGRGRADHRWIDWPGSLLFSIAARWSDFELTRRESAVLSLRVADAVAETFRDAVARELGVERTTALDARTSVKPPNDVLCDGRKISGILVESPNSEQLVVGIGVNVANETSSAPNLRDCERANSLVDVVATIRPDKRDELRARSEELREAFLAELVDRLLAPRKFSQKFPN